MDRVTNNLASIIIRGSFNSGYSYQVVGSVLRFARTSLAVRRYAPDRNRRVVGLRGRATARRHRRYAARLVPCLQVDRQHTL